MSDGHGGTVIGTPAVGDILYTLTGYVNANSTKTSGVDVETSYRFKLGEYGSLKTGFQITHLMSYVLTANGIAYQLAGTHGPSGTGGDTGNPKNRAQVNLSYDKGAFNATTILNWVGKYNTSDPSVGRTTCTAGINSIYSRFPNVAVPPQQYCTVASFMSTDLTLSYKVGKNWTLHGTVLNLFNRAPPTDVATFGAPGGGVAAYNPAMAQAGAVGRFFNLGASYKF
jgi:iron complex outermembrane receptor protein